MCDNQACNSSADLCSLECSCSDVTDILSARETRGDSRYTPSTVCRLPATFELSMQAPSYLPSTFYLFQIKGCGRVTGYRHTLFRPSPSYGNSCSSRCPSPSVTAPPHLLTTRNYIQAFTSSMTYIPPDEDGPTPEAPIMIA